MRIWALSLVLGVVALASGCVFTDLADLPPPIAIQNNPTNNGMDTDLDTADMDSDTRPEDCPEPEFFTNSGVTHLGLDQFEDTVLYAAVLARGGIQLGRVEGNTHTVIPINLPANNIHSLEVTAIGTSHMVVAVIEGANRSLRLFNCEGNTCEGFDLGTGFVTSEILDITLDKDPLSVGLRREISGTERYTARLLDITGDPVLGAAILSLAPPDDDVFGVRHIGIGQARYRVVGGRPGTGYFFGEGETPVTITGCGGFDRTAAIPYFTRLKPGGSKFLLRTRTLLLTDCTNTTELSPQLIGDADYLHIAEDDYFAAWISLDGIEAAFAGDDVATLTLSDAAVQHVRVGRTEDDFLVFTGGTNTNLSMLRGTKDELIACFEK